MMMIMMMMMRMIEKVALKLLKIGYDVVWGIGIHILVHQISAKKPDGFMSRLKLEYSVPRTPKIDSIRQNPSRLPLNN